MEGPPSQQQRREMVMMSTSSERSQSHAIREKPCETNLLAEGARLSSSQSNIHCTNPSSGSASLGVASEQGLVRRRVRDWARPKLLKMLRPEPHLPKGSTSHACEGRAEACASATWSSKVNKMNGAACASAARGHWLYFPTLASRSDVFSCSSCERSWSL